MKVTVTKYLNVRVGKPSVNAPCYQYLAPGSEIETDGKLYKGDKYKDIDTWVKDESGNYYWSGGINQVTEIVKNEVLIEVKNSQLDWYHKEFRIADIWDEFGIQGEGATVAVLDSGIDKDHPYFKTSSIAGHNYHNETDSDYDDKYGHGTQVSSILIAQGNKSIGVAPRCKVFAAKIFEYGSATPAGVTKAINQLPDTVDIVVISHSFLKIDISDTFIDAFRSPNRIYVCSPGNDDNHQSRIINRYPASFQIDNVLSVAAVGQGKQIYSKSTKSDFIDIAAPGDRVKVISPFDLTEPASSSGTSFSAPFVAGVLALMISLARSKQKQFNPAELISILLSTADPSPDSKLFGKGIINPYEAIKKLKTLL